MRRRPMKPNENNHNNNNSNRQLLPSYVTHKHIYKHTQYYIHFSFFLFSKAFFEVSFVYDRARSFSFVHALKFFPILAHL